MNSTNYCKSFPMINYAKNRDKLKKFTENNRTFSLNNPNKKCFGYVKGESTATDSGQKRCDYIICFEFGTDQSPKKPNNYLFVELKGSDNEKAMAQIVSTIQYLLQNGLAKDCQVECFIVSGSCPSVKTKDQILKAKFPFGKAPYKYPLTFRTKFAEYQIK